MNKTLVCILLFIGLNLNSQEDRFTLSAYTEPQLYFNDGFNIGTAIEYQAEFGMYFKVQTFYFPNLNGIDYLDVEGVVGFNYRSIFDNWRLFIGGKLGAIYRQGWGHPKSGAEAGVEYYFNKVYIGLQTSCNYRTDGRVWETKADNYWTIDTGIKFGITL